MTHSLAFSFLVHCSVDDVLLPVSESMLSCIYFCTFLNYILWPIFFRWQVSIPSIMHSSEDILAIILQKVSQPGFQCTLLVTQSVACLVSVSELVWF